MSNFKRYSKELYYIVILFDNFLLVSLSALGYCGSADKCFNLKLKISHNMLVHITIVKGVMHSDMVKIGRDM